MKIAVVGIPGGWSSERLAAALRDAGADARVLDLSQCSLRLPERHLYAGGLAIDGLDGVVVKKLGDTADGWIVEERINLLRHLEASGVRVWSPPDRIEAAVNRFRMTVELTRARLPIPETIITEDAIEALAAVERFQSAVLKPLFTSKGRGMLKLEPKDDLLTLLTRYRADGLGPFYLQRYIEHPGRDLGIAVLDGRYLGAYWRLAAPQQWMTTIRSGGVYAAADPPVEAIDLAVRAANHFGLAFTGVDLMETPDAGFVVLEVSAFGGFRGLLDGCGIDAAPALARVILRRLAEAPIANGRD